MCGSSSGNSNSYLTLRFVEADYDRLRAIGTEIQNTFKTASSVNAAGSQHAIEGDDENTWASPTLDPTTRGGGPMASLDVLDKPWHFEECSFNDLKKGMILRIKHRGEEGLFRLSGLATDGGSCQIDRLCGGIDPDSGRILSSAQTLGALVVDKELSLSMKMLRGLRPVVVAVPKMLGVFSNDTDDLSEEADASTTQAGRIGFDPQNDNLHLTLAFFGDGLHKPATSPETIMQLHRMIKDQVANHMVDFLGEEGVSCLYINAFEQFPPGKHNLIVARLEFRNVLHELFIRKVWLKAHYLLIAAGVKVRGAPRLPAVLSLSTSGSCSKAKKAGTAASSSSSLPDAEILLKSVDGLSVNELRDLTSEWQPHFTLGKIAATTAQLGQKIVTDVVRALNEKYAGSEAGGHTVAYRFPLSAIGVGMGGQVPVKAGHLDWNELIVGAAIDQ